MARARGPAHISKFRHVLARVKDAIQFTTSIFLPDNQT